MATRLEWVGFYGVSSPHSKLVEACPRPGRTENDADSWDGVHAQGIG